MYGSILEEGAVRTLPLVIHPRCIEETQGKPGAGACEEPVDCFLDAFVLVHEITHTLGSAVTLWSWHP